MPVTRSCVLALLVIGCASGPPPNAPRQRDAIDADFTAESTCAKDRQVRDVLLSMPTL